MNQKAIENPKGLEIYFLQSPDAESLEKLLKTQWGNPGEILFRQQNLEVNLRNTENLFWVCFKRRSQCLMMFAMVYQRLVWSSNPVNLYLIRYFFSLQKGQNISKNTNSKIKKRNLKSTGKSIFRNLGANLFNTPPELPLGDSSISKNIYFAYIEKGNSASMEMAGSMDFIPLSIVKSVPFCRWNPKISDRVYKSGDKDRPSLCKLLEEFYKEYSFFRSEEIFARGEYYVLQSGGRIAAGVQVIQNEMILEQLNGLKGFFSTKILPHIPLLYKRINPRDFKFLLMGSVYVRPGMDAFLPELIESVLATKKMHTAMLWTDSDCKVRKSMLKTGKRGVLSLLFPSVSVQSVARYQGFTNNEINEMKQLRQFVSISDLV